MESVPIVVIGVIREMIAELLTVHRREHFHQFPIGDLLELDLEMLRKLFRHLWERTICLYDTAPLLAAEMHYLTDYHNIAISRGADRAPNRGVVLPR